MAGLHLAALILPGRFSPARLADPAPAPAAQSANLAGRQRETSLPQEACLPQLSLDELPGGIREVLRLVPQVVLDEGGLLRLIDAHGAAEAVTLARTQWNLEHSQPQDRLLTDIPWGLVLHWYGEPEGFDKTLTGYLRGFDGLRRVNDYITRTSAHFLVGDAPAVAQERMQPDQIGIVQTQMPDADGVPYVASHLRPLNYELHRARQQYYVKALDALAYQDAAIHSLLQDFFENPKIDPGWRTIAIEVTGRDFDSPQAAPSAQKIANLLAVVVAVMKRYQISALDILGHQEIELQKSDPGRGFMAYFRTLLGVKALVDDDEPLKALVFGRFMADERDARHAVWRYFQFVRDYLVWVSKPAEVYAWEKRSSFWLVCDLLPGRQGRQQAVDSFGLPLRGEMSTLGDDYLKPEFHEGVDLFADGEAKLTTATPVYLVADGECLYTGKSQGHCPGKMAIFRHRQPDGTLILTVYSHLSQLASLQVGKVYPKGQRIGKITSPLPFMERYLHFAVAYGAAWETDLRRRPSLPLDAKPAWIKERYLSPLAFLSSRVLPDEELGERQDY